MGWMRWRDGLASSWWGLILAEHDTEPMELLGGAAKLLLGAHLLAPWQTFVGNVHLYADMAALPEWAWGTALVALGIGHLGALRNGDYGWRRWSSFAGFLVWASLGATFLHTQPTALIGPTLLVFAAGQGWCYVRLGEPSRAAGA